MSYAKAQLTGNDVIVMAWAGGRASTRALLRNWTRFLQTGLGVLCDVLVDLRPRAGE